MMDDLISKLSEIRSQYNCFNESEEPYYRALSEVIKKLSEQADGDTISRQAAITDIQKAYADTEGGTDKCAVWKNVGLTNALHIMQDLPSAQPTQNERVNSNNPLDYISRQAAIDELRDYLVKDVQFGDELTAGYNDGIDMAIATISKISSSQPEQSNVSEFWRKRADYYSDLCMRLIAEMGKGVKIDSVKISESGIEFIKEQPSAQPEQRWIPCSERLPEEDDYKSCIECLDGAVWYFTENGTMGIGYYYKSTKEWSTTDDLKTDGKVIAWMPLPEPYGGERE